MSMEYFDRNPLNERLVESVDELFELIERFREDFLFRGVADFSYEIKSSLERSAPWGATSENWLLEQFQRAIHMYLPVELHPTNKFEWLSLMQHHGVPTRLIDVTKSPYVALYFASSNYFYPSDRIKDGAVYVFSHRKLMSVSIDNLHKRKKKLDCDFNRLSSFLKHDSQLFDEVFYHNHDDVALIIEPNRWNSRLHAQQGLFLVTNSSAGGTTQLLKELLLPDLRDGVYDTAMMRIRFPGKFKSDILRRLDRMNVNSSTLFPGLDGFAKHLYEKSLYLHPDLMNDWHRY